MIHLIYKTVPRSWWLVSRMSMSAVRQRQKHSFVPVSAASRLASSVGVASCTRLL